MTNWKTTMGGVAVGLTAFAKAAELFAAGNIFGAIGAAVAGCGAIFAGYHAQDK